MIAINIASPEELDAIDLDAKKEVFEGKKAAWIAFINPIIEEQESLITILERISETNPKKEEILKNISYLKKIKSPLKKEILVVARKTLRIVIDENSKIDLSNWITNYTNKTQSKFSSNLFSESDKNVF